MKHAKGKQSTRRQQRGSHRVRKDGKTHALACVKLCEALEVKLPSVEPGGDVMSLRYSPAHKALVAVHAPPDANVPVVEPHVGLLEELLCVTDHHDPGGGGDAPPGPPVPCVLGVVHTVHGRILCPWEYLHRVQGAGSWHMTRILRAALEVSVSECPLACVQSGATGLDTKVPHVTHPAPIPVIATVTIPMVATTAKFCSPALHRVLKDVHVAVSRSYVAGIAAAHLFLRFVYAAGLHRTARVADTLGPSLFEVFHAACAHFCPGHRGNRELQYDGIDPVLACYWKHALHTVSAACPSLRPVDGASATGGNTVILRRAVEQYMSTNVRAQCGDSLGSVVKRTLAHAGVVPQRSLASVVKGPLSAVSADVKTALQEHDRGTSPSAAALGLYPTLSIYFAIKDGSRLSTDALKARVRHAVVQVEPMDRDFSEPEPEAELEHHDADGHGDCDLNHHDAEADDHDVEEDTGTTTGSLDRVRLSWRVFGCLAVRWDALSQAAQLSSERQRLRGTPHGDVGTNLKGKGSATAPSFLPLPRPAGIPVRICRCDVAVLLNRAGKVHADGGGGGGGGGGGSSEVPGQADLRQLFNVDNPSISKHMARYGSNLGRSFLYTGGGLRFQVSRVSLSFVDATIHDAAEWTGACRGVLRAPPVYDRPLYGKEDMPARSPEEVRAKQAAFLVGPGSFLVDQHLTPEIVRAYFERTGAKWSISDPGVSAPLAFAGATYLCLREIYAFLACGYHRRPKPDAVRLAEAGLSRTSPRQGIIGILSYVSELAKVGYSLV